MQVYKLFIDLQELKTTPIPEESTKAYCKLKHIEDDLNVLMSLIRNMK